MNSFIKIITTNIGVTLLMMIFFLPLYFLIQWVKSSSKILNSKINGTILSIFEAGIYGGFFIFFEMIARDVSSLSINQYFIISVFLIFLIKDGVFATITLLVSSSYYVFKNSADIDTNFYLTIIFIYSSLITYEILNYFFHKRATRMLSVLFIVGYSFIFFMVSAFGLDKTNRRDLFIESIFPFYLAIIATYILSYFIEFSISANILYESSSFFYSRVYRQALLHKRTGQFISENKISSAVMGSINMKFPILNNKEKREIIKKSILKIEKYFDKDILLFIDNNSILFFYSTSDETKHLGYMEAAKNIGIWIEKCNDGFIEYGESNIDVKFSASFARYGHDSSSLSELRRFIDYTNALRVDEKVKAFSYKEYQKSSDEKKLVENLDWKIALDNYKILYIPLVEIETEENNIWFAKVENISDDYYIDNIREYMNGINMLSTFERYFATEIIKANASTKDTIVFPYPAKNLSTDFDLENFQRVISRYKFEPNKMVLYIRLRESLDDDKFIFNIKELMKMGVSFIVPILEEEQFKEMFKRKPTLTMWSQKVEQFETQNAIYPFIDDEKLMNSHLSAFKQMKYLGGKIFDINNKLTNFSKTSKIYLRGLLEEQWK